VQAAGRLVKRKLPAASELVEPEHPVGLLASSLPRKTMRMPGIGDSIVSDSRIRPKKEVVICSTASVAVVVCVDAIPSTVAEAEIVKVELPTGCAAGAFTVKIEICPFVICGGLKLEVTPVGSPETLNEASWLNPFVLFKLMEYAALCPCSTFAVAGPALTLKVVLAVMESVAVETADSPTVVSVTRPSVAPGGIRNETLVALLFVTGAEIVPPPC